MTALKKLSTALNSFKVLSDRVSSTEESEARLCADVVHRKLNIMTSNTPCFLLIASRKFALETAHYNQDLDIAKFFANR